VQSPEWAMNVWAPTARTGVTPSEKDPDVSVTVAITVNFAPSPM